VLGKSVVIIECNPSLSCQSHESMSSVTVKPGHSTTAPTDPSTRGRGSERRVGAYLSRANRIDDGAMAKAIVTFSLPIKLRGKHATDSMCVSPMRLMSAYLDTPTVMFFQ